MSEPRVDESAIGPPDPRRAWEREREAAFGPVEGPPAPEGSIEARARRGDELLDPIRQREGTGLRNHPRRW